jgi:hypothetical protein
VVEGTPLLREHTPKKVYRGFESLSLRHKKMPRMGHFCCGDGGVRKLCSHNPSFRQCCPLFPSFLVTLRRRGGMWYLPRHVGGLSASPIQPPGPRTASVRWRGHLSSDVDRVDAVHTVVNRTYVRSHTYFDNRCRRAAVSKLWTETYDTFRETRTR